MAEKRIQGNNRLDLPSKGRAYFDGPFGINSSNLPIIDEGDNQFNLTLNQEGITSLAPNVIVKPAPPTKSVQFNEDDEFGGTPDFVYDYYVENVGIGTYDPTIKTQIFNELGFNDDGTIYTIAPSGSNHIYVGGNFERYIGKEYNNIIKLDLSGSVDTSFNIGKGFNGPVYAITLKDDKLYVGGDFTTYSGSSNVNRIVRLNSNGTIDNTFNTNEGFDNTVYSILLSTITNDDAIFVGGNFTKYSNNFNSNKIIKITGSGNIDPTFNPNGGFDANPSSSIYSIVHNSADPTYLYVAGKFTNYSGSSDYQYGNSGILKISSSGQVDTSFNQSSSIAGGTSGSIVYTIYHPNANDLYIGGDFTKYSGSTVSKVTKLNKDTGQLEWLGSFPTLSGGGVRTIHFVSSSNYILIGGLFSISAGSGTVQKLTLLNSANGSLIGNNIAGRTLIGGGDVYTSAVLNNTASIIGGDFKQYRPNFVLGQVNPIQLVNCDKIIIVETPSLYPQTSSYSSFFSFDYRNRDSFFISTSLGVFKTISSSHNTSLVVKNSGYVGFNTGSPDSAFHLYYGEGPLMRIDSAYSSSILFVTSSGIVGVLTGLPNGDENVRLHVSGAIRAHLSESSTQYVITYNTSSGLFTYFTASGIGDATLPAPPTKSVQFNKDDEFGGTSDFVYDYKQDILPYGAVGIGIYDPTAKLHVSGTFQQGGLGVIAIGTGSHAQGESTLASGDYSHAEGYLTVASSEGSHAEGSETIASGIHSHAEGYLTVASGAYSHAEGRGAKGKPSAIGNYSHAEGIDTQAFGEGAHSEGFESIAYGEYSHAGGYDTLASGAYSATWGAYTTASYAGQFVIGIHNIITNTAHSFIIGNGQDAANKKNLVETSGSNFIITGSLYLTESRNISQQHLLMYNAASGEVTYFTASSAGGSSTPAPPTKSIQYNNAGTFGGNSNFIYDYDTSKMGIFTSTPEALLHINTQQSEPNFSKLFRIDSPELDVYGNLLSNIIYVTSSGQVGINTNTPNAKLHIVGNGSFDDPPQYLLLVDDNQDDPYNLVARFGRIGIGYNSPQFKLHISGGISAILPYELQNYIIMYDTNNGEFTYYDASAFGGGTPGGNNQSVQYNDGGSFGGDSYFTWDDTNLKLTITGSLYLTESRNIPQQHFLMYDTASGEVTYFNRTAAIITTDGNITIDVAKTSSVFWSASFSADRVMSCSFSNAAVGTSLRVMVRNAGASSRIITFATETSTPNTYNYSGNNFANSAGLFFKSGSTINANGASNIEIIKVSNGTYIGTILASNPL